METMKRAINTNPTDIKDILNKYNWWTQLGNLHDLDTF